MKDESGTPITAAGTVSVSAAGGYASVAAIQDGNYRLEDLVPGTYTLRAEAKGFIAPDAVAVQVNANQELRHDFRLTPEPQSVISRTGDWFSEGAGLLAVVVFLFSVLLTRWFKIARQSQNLLEAQMLAVESRLNTDVDAQMQNTDKVVEALREQLCKSRREFFCKRWFSRLSRFLFWSQNNENACWKAVHEVERQLASYLAPTEAVTVNLIKFGPRLRAFAVVLGFAERWFGSLANVVQQQADKQTELTTSSTATPKQQA